MEIFDLSKIVIRGIKESDVDAIVEIEEKNLGIKRGRVLEKGTSKK